MLEAKPLYVEFAHRARTTMTRVGLLRALERSDRRWARHVRTLFAIHDVEDLAALDLPWWTYRAIRHVDEFLRRRDASVFEYGCGASTVWLARRATHVTSIEHEPEFARTVERLLAPFPHATVLTYPAERSDASAIRSQRRGMEGRDFTSYVHAIDEVDDTFDLIIVDGRARLACLHRALEHLEPDGMIVFDDIQRPRYRPARHFEGLEGRLMTGAKPCLPYPSSTALLRLRPTTP